MFTNRQMTASLPGTGVRRGYRIGLEFVQELLLARRRDPGETSVMIGISKQISGCM